MNYADKASEYGIKLIWTNKIMGRGGTNVSFPFENYPNGAIFIQDNLDEITTYNVFEHELGQLINGQPIHSSSAPALHLNSESKANRYMVRKKATEWLQGFEGNYPTSLDVVSFLKWSRLSSKMYAIAEDELKDLATPANGSFL